MVSMPIVMILLITSVYSFSGRFILSNMVNDKETKMRESLRIMSLSRMSYSLSYFIVQGVLSVIESIIISLFVQLSKGIIYEDSWQIYLLLILFGLANISFSMALSTFFSDSRLANQLGGLLLILPVAFFCSLTSGTINYDTGRVDPNSVYWVLYFFYWIPVVPTCVILNNLIDNPFVSEKNFGIFQTYKMPNWLAFACLAISIPLWYLGYLYLDSVIPNTYGIAKHPLFCLRKS